MSPHSARKTAAATIAAVALLSTTACAGEDSSAESSTTTVTSTTSATHTATGQSGTAAPATAAARLGSSQTVRGQGFTAEIQVSNDPRRTVLNGKTELVVFEVSITVASGQVKPQNISWRLITGSSVPYYSVPTALPTALGTAPIDQHAEGLIAFGNPNLGDSVTIDRIELFDKMSTSAHDTPVMQWRAPKPVAVSGLPILEIS